MNGEEDLERLQERFDNAMRDKKVKENIMKREKERKMQ